MAKVLVSLDDRLLRRIDAVARARGLSRSAYLAQLAATDVGAPRSTRERRRIREALRGLDRLFAEHPPDEEDSTAVIRAFRDAR